MKIKKMKLAFFGAPHFAAEVLKNIIEDKDLPIELCFVVTQPDRPVGRKQTITPTPVKIMAKQNGIPVIETLTSPEIEDKLKEIDLVLLYAFGELIPKKMLTIPRWGFWNIHPSLLPEYRGPSPITYPLLMGDKKTGVSLIMMDEKLDHGPIIDQEEYEIQKNDTRTSLENRLSEIGYRLFKKYVQILLDGRIQKYNQNDIKATYTRLLTKKDGYLPFETVQTILKKESITKGDTPSIVVDFLSKYGVKSTFDYQLSIYNWYRAFFPWPGLWTIVQINGEEKRLKITGIELKEGRTAISKVQLEGKKEVDINTFIRAYSQLF